MSVGLFRAVRVQVRRWWVLVLVATLAVSVTTAVTVFGSAKPAIAADTSTPVAGAADDSRPDEVSARLAARLSGSRVRIESMTTDSTDTYANPDGSTTLDTAAQPYQAPVGDVWKPIDTALQPTADGIAPKLAEGSPILSDGGTGPLASVTVDGKRVSWSWPTALPSPTLDGDTATYANVGGAATPGEDLKVTATVAGFEVKIILNQEPAGTGGITVPLTMSAPGLSTTRDGNGALHLKTAAGAEVAAASTPVAFNDTGEIGTVTPPEDTTPSTSLAGAKLTYGISGSFLHADSTDYPVTLDPGIAASLGRAHWSIVDVHKPTTVAYDSGVPQIGSNNGGVDVYRTFFQFNTGGLAGKVIRSAVFNIGILSSGAACTSPTEYDLSSVNGDISPATTWNNQPGRDLLYGRYSSARGDGNPSCPPGVDGLVGTGPQGLVQAWATARLATATAEFWSPSDADNAYYKSFNSAPNIAITYNAVPSTPNSTSVTPCEFKCSNGSAVTATDSPSLTARAADADGGDADGSLRYDFEVYSPSALVATGSETAVIGDTASFDVPSGVLADGGAYWYRVRAWDDFQFGPWSAAFNFTVDLTAPAVPTVTSQDFFAGQWVPTRTTGSFEFADSSPDAVNFQWKLDDDDFSDWSTDRSTSDLDPGDGWHTLTVQAADDAGNISSTAVSFGVGAGLTSPHDDAHTARFSRLASVAPANRPYATYQLRVGTTGAFATLNTANVTIPGTNTHPAWPQQGTVSVATATFANLTLDSRAALGADGVIGLRACYASDAAGNDSVCSQPVTVEVAQQTPSSATSAIGPGTVDLTSGNFTASTTDVTVAAFTGSLALGRSVTTIIANAATSGAAGVFGPGWAADLQGPSSGAATLRLTDHSANGYVMLTDTTGSIVQYTRPTNSGTTFTGLTDANDGSVLTANTATSPTQYTLTELDGTATVWTGSGGAWKVQSVTEKGSLTTTYTYDGSGRVTRILAPVPVGVSCATPTSTVGCRSLNLIYATATGAQADDPSGMVDYSGRLVAVDFTAADPSNSNAMTTIRMARYGYDSTGALVGEWDPRTASPLVTRYSYSGGRLASTTPAGLKPVQLAYDSSGKLATVTRHDDALNQDAVTRVAYGITWDNPAAGSGLPNMNASATAVWGQDHDVVATATALFPPDHPASAAPAAADWPYASLHYVDSDAREVDAAAYGAGAWQIGATQYDDDGNTVWSLSPGNRAQALAPTVDTDATVAAVSTPAARANLLASVATFSADGVDPIDSTGPTRPVLVNGVTYHARPYTSSTYDQGAPAGGPYRLVTSTVSGSKDAVSGTVYDPITSTLGYGALVAGDPAGWSLDQPTSSAVTVTNNQGAASTLVKRTRYDTLGRPIESRIPGATADAAGNATDARSTRTSYYTATGTGPCVSASLAGWVCSNGPAMQPATGNPLPVSTATYNIYGLPLAATQTTGATVRTSTTAYDPATRPLTTATAVAPAAAGGTALPTVSFSYQPTTGLPTTQTAGGKTLTTAYDTSGRVTSYTDSTGIAATTTYDLDGRPASTYDGKASTTYSYDSATEHRGLLTSENVSSGFGSAASTVTAAYDTAGQLATLTYPNGITATTRFDNVGGKTALTYAKSGTTWMTFTQTAGTRGTAAQTGPLSSQAYSYDQAGRLINTQDTVTGSGTKTCTTRQYSFDADSNRTALNSFPDDGTDTTNGHCSTATTPVTVASTIDDADRLTNTGYTYDTLGRTSTVPGSDALGIGSYSTTTGTLSNGYYANDLSASQTQGGKTISFALDPMQSRFASQTAGSVVSTNHYGDSSDSPTWIATSSTAWTRNLIGPSGLIGTQSQSGSITLRLQNLHGDIVAAASDSSTATGISSYTESTEYGAPRVAQGGYKPYGYLGAARRSADDLGGVILMGVRLYNPTTGRFLSTDSVYGGNDNPYSYPTNPIDGSDLNGQCATGNPWKDCDPYRITDESSGFGVYMHVVREGRDKLGFGYRHIHAGHVGVGKPSAWATDAFMYADVFALMASPHKLEKFERENVYRYRWTTTRRTMRAGECGCSGRSGRVQKVVITVFYDWNLQSDGFPLGVRTAYINRAK